MENQKEFCEKNNEDINKNNANNNIEDNIVQNKDESTDSDAVEKDIELIGNAIRIICIFFGIVAFGVFAWFIGKDILQVVVSIT